MPEAGTCPACRAARLSRRNDPLCLACIQAARETAPHPLWMFDSPLLRQALAEANLPAVPAIVRAASGLSQTDLAVVAGLSRSALGLYERGQRSAVFDIRVLIRFADAVDMPRQALLPLVVGQPDATLAEDCVPEGTAVDVNRRALGGLAVGAAAAAMLPETRVPSRVTGSHVRYLQASLDGLWARDRVVGGGALLRSAVRQWQRARRMLKESSYNESVGRQLLGVAGYLADISGWLAFDAANVPLARQMYADARQLAADSGDPVLSAWVLAHQSGLSSYEASKEQAGTMTWKRARLAGDALVLANSAAEEARYEPMPRLQVMILLRRAYAASLLGDETTFRSAITRARRELDRVSDTSEPGWIAEVGENNIVEEEARGRSNLGQPAHGEKLYRALLDSELTPRARAFLGARLAGALLDQGARNDAITAGTAALTCLADGVTSVRTLNELRPVRLAARRADGEEFCTRFDAVERSLAAV